MSEAVARYGWLDTSDKLDDETWTGYWDRKRRERHGENCVCILCDNEVLLKEMGRRMLPPDMRAWVE